MIESRIAADAVVGVAKAAGTAISGLGQVATVWLALEYLGIPVLTQLKDAVLNHENPFVPNFLLDDEQKDLRKEETEKLVDDSEGFFVDASLWLGNLLFGPDSPLS